MRLVHSAGGFAVGMNEFLPGVPNEDGAAGDAAASGPRVGESCVGGLTTTGTS